MATDTNERPEVVITGIGVVSPIGIGVDDFWDSLSNGKSGIAETEFLSHVALPRNISGEVKGFTDKMPKAALPKQQRKFVRVMCREIEIGVTAAMQSLQQSGIDLESIDHSRFGVDFGANLMFSPPDVLKDACWECVDEGDSQLKFQYGRWGDDGLPKMEPLWLLKYLPNMPACHIGIAVDARGPNNSVTLDEASGNAVLGEAFHIIRRGAADVMIAGSTGTRLHPVKSMHARMWDDLAEGDGPPETWCKPFDKNRTGQVAAEGAGSFILEERKHAEARGAEIYGTINGVGSSCVAKPNGEADMKQALVNAMRAALNSAGMTPEEIGHINAHGLGSPSVDKTEAEAIREVFGELAETIPVVAFKSYFGNMGSGCGPIELAASLLAIKHGQLPPTLNYDVPDPEIGLNVVHGLAAKIDKPAVMKINVTRMGQATAVIVSG